MPRVKSPAATEREQQRPTADGPAPASSAGSTPAQKKKKNAIKRGGIPPLWGRPTKNAFFCLVFTAVGGAPSVHVGAHIVETAPTRSCSRCGDAQHPPRSKPPFIDAGVLPAAAGFAAKMVLPGRAPYGLEQSDLPLEHNARGHAARRSRYLLERGLRRLSRAAERK